jgi:hypothetical protein
MFGGETERDMLADTWEWNGQGWKPVGAAAAAPDTVLVGRLRRQITVPRVDTLVMLRPSGDTVVRGPMEITRIEAASHQGQPSYLVSSCNVSPSGVAGTYDSTMLANPSLGAIWHHSRSRQTMLLSFDAPAVTGMISVGDSLVERIDLTVPTAPYYFGAIAVVLGALPLEAGYRAVLPVQEGKRSRYATVVVMGKDSIATMSGHSIETWRIDVSLGGNPQTYWIGTRAGEVVRRELRISPTITIRYLKP